MNEIKDKLTIIIPLKGRDYATKRILDNMSSDNIPFKILLADGSGQDKSDLCSNEQYPNLDISYIDFGEDKTVHDFMHKLYRASCMVDTPFTVLIDNDDIVSLDGLCTAVEFLTNNEEYVSFRGALLERGTNDNYHTNKDSIVNDNILDRVSVDLVGKDAAWQDVTRTNIVQKLYELLFKSGTEDLMLTFTIDASFRLIYGKNHRDFNCPLVYHIHGDSLVMGRSDWFGYKGWFKSQHINETLGLYVSTIANGMNKKDGIPLAEAKRDFAEFLLGDICEHSTIDINKEDKVLEAIEMSLKYDELVGEVL